MTREFAIALAVMNLTCRTPNCGSTPHAGFLASMWDKIEAEAEVMLRIAETREQHGSTRSD